MKKSWMFVAMLVLVGANRASASNEINGLFDARSTGMGGTGVAFLSSAGAIPANPALLDQIDKFTLTANVFLIASQPERPYTIYHRNAAGEIVRTYETIRSPVEAPSPLPFLGGAYRIFDRVVIGAAIYPVIGSGTHAKYRPAPDEFPDLEVVNKASLGFIEGSVPISVRILDNLSFGASWRMTYMIQKVDTVPEAGPPTGILRDLDGNPVRAKIDLTGFSFTGFQLGLLYRPIPALRLGLSYRSKVTVDGEGETTTTDPLSGNTLVIPTMQSFSDPHAIRAGFAVTLLEDKLLLAGDFKYLMYSEAFKTINTTTVQNGVSSTNVQVTNWIDAYNIQLGAEYQLSDLVSVRAGYIMATTATPDDYALAFMAPPGNSHLGSIGLGLKVLESLNVDTAFAYVSAGHRVARATEFNAGVGRYVSNAFQFALSLTYHI